MFDAHAETLGSIADRDAWLARRRTGLGASDAAAIVGKDPSKGPLSVYASTLGIYEPDFSDSPEVSLGLACEPVVIARYRDQTGRPVEPGGVQLRSRAHPILLATLDATTAIDGVTVPLEIKTTGPWRAEDWADGAPPRAWWQSQQQMLVTGTRRASVAALIWPRVVWCDVERDDAAGAHLLRCAEELWARIQRLDPPPAVDPAASAVLKAMYPADTGATIALPGSLIEVSDRLRAAKEAASDLKKAIEADEALIKQAIGNASLGILPDRTSWSWKKQDVRAYTVAAKSKRVLLSHVPKGL